MKFLIRCDSSFQIGTGHVSRCLNLAEEVKEKGHDVIFLCRNLPGNIISLIQEKQIKVLLTETLSPVYDTTLQETRALTEAVLLEKPDFIILDHYELGEEWEQIVKGFGIPILVIEDGIRAHDCQFVLNQNIGAEAKGTYKKAFLGPEYALLSRKMRNTTVPKRSFDKVQNVIIFFGGTDPQRDTLKVLSFLKDRELNFDLHVVAGKTNPDISEIKKIIRNWKSTELHVQTPHMNLLLAQADIFIGAGGITTWERCYFGLPSICIAVAENQIKIAEHLAKKEVQIYLGTSQEVTNESFMEGFEDLLKNREARVKLSKNSLDLRISGKLTELVDALTNKNLY